MAATSVEDCAIACDRGGVSASAPGTRIRDRRRGRSVGRGDSHDELMRPRRRGSRAPSRAAGTRRSRRRPTNRARSGRNGARPTRHSRPAIRSPTARRLSPRVSSRSSRFSPPMSARWSSQTSATRCEREPRAGRRAVSRGTTTGAVGRRDRRPRAAGAVEEAGEAVAAAVAEGRRRDDLEVEVRAVVTAFALRAPRDGADAVAPGRERDTHAAPGPRLRSPRRSSSATARAARRHSNFDRRTRAQRCPP